MIEIFLWCQAIGFFVVLLLDSLEVQRDDYPKKPKSFWWWVFATVTCGLMTFSLATTLMLFAYSPRECMAIFGV